MPKLEPDCGTPAGTPDRVVAKLLAMRLGWAMLETASGSDVLVSQEAA